MEGRFKWKQRRNAHTAMSFISMTRGNSIPNSPRHLRAIPDLFSAPRWAVLSLYSRAGRAFPSLPKNPREEQENQPCLFLQGKALPSSLLLHAALSLSETFLCPSWCLHNFVSIKHCTCNSSLKWIYLFFIHDMCICIRTTFPWNCENSLLPWPPNVPDVFSTFPSTQSQSWAPPQD